MRVQRSEKPLQGPMQIRKNLPSWNRAAASATRGPRPTRA